MPDIVRNYLIVWVLLYEAYLRRSLKRRYILYRLFPVEDPAFPGAGRLKAGLYLAKKRGLAAARRAAQDNILTFINLKIYLIQSSYRSIRIGEA